MVLPSLLPRTAPARLPAWPLLIAAVAAAFFPALDGAFLSWDDLRYLEDSAIQGTTCFLARAASIVSTGYFGNYNPLHRAGNWLELMVFGRDPRGFHLVSLVLHALNVLLAFRLAGKLGLPRAAACIAALVFAVHPSRTEAVAWISAQKDLGSALFVLLALNAYSPVLTGEPGRRGRRLLAVGLLFLLALLDKSMVLTFPLLLLVLDLAWRRPFRTAFLEKVPFLATSAAFALFTLGSAPRIGPLGGSWESHAATAVKAPAIYLARVFWPFSFSARRWVERPASFLDLAPVAASALLLAGMAAAILLVRGRHRRRVLLAAAWPAVCLLPVLNIVPLPVEVADRYLYLALLGPLLAAFGGATSAGAPGSPPASAPRPVLAGGAAAICVFVLVTRGHSRAFHDGETLWRESLRSDPRNPIARLNLSLELLRSKPDAARARECLDLLERPPDVGQEVQGFLVARSRALEVLGLEERAGEELDRALAAAGRGRLRIETALARSRRLSKEGRFAEADRVLREFVPRWPMEEEEIAAARAAVCLQAGDDAGFIRFTRELLTFRPFDLALWNNREMAARRLGLHGEARLCARRFQAILGRQG